MKIKKRGFLNIPFSWMFAIIAGAFILFLAIYMSMKIVDVEQYSLNAETAKELGVLLNPLEMGFESGKTTSLEFPSETRFYNECEENGNFGKQKISISQKSLNKWPESAEPVIFSNKYIFSEEIAEGKKFYIFSKPLEFPFKISDLIYLISSEENYCFIEAPEKIKDEIEDLSQENLFTKDCPEDSIKICFGISSDCDIEVEYNAGYVNKNSERLYFINDALMYAAIFSEKDIYECQIKRLMKRTENLGLIYQDKASLVAKQNCNSNLNLISLINSAKNLENSEDLISMEFLIENIKEKNENADCRLW